MIMELVNNYGCGEAGKSFLLACDGLDVRIPVATVSIAKTCNNSKTLSNSYECHGFLEMTLYANVPFHSRHGR